MSTFMSAKSTISFVISTRSIDLIVEGKLTGDSRKNDTKVDTTDIKSEINLSSSSSSFSSSSSSSSSSSCSSDEHELQTLKRNYEDLESEFKQAQKTINTLTKASWLYFKEKAEAAKESKVNVERLESEVAKLSEELSKKV